MSMDLSTVPVTDADGRQLKPGDRVTIGPEQLSSSDWSRYRSQRYGAGVIQSVSFDGVYVLVDGGNDNTFACADWYWYLGAPTSRRCSKVKKILSA